MCPWILSDPSAYLLLVGGLYEMKNPAMVTEGSAEQEKPIFNEAVHERRVLGPASLLPDLA